MALFLNSLSFAPIQMAEFLIGAVIERRRIFIEVDIDAQLHRIVHYILFFFPVEYFFSDFGFLYLILPCNFFHRDLVGRFLRGPV